VKHLNEQRLSAMVDGALSAREREEAERHLATCESCRATLAEWIEREGTLKSALTHDPGDEYFESFPARVIERLHAEGASAMREPERRGVAAWLSQPRRLAWAGGVAALIVGAGLVFVSTRESRMPTMSRALVGDRSEESKERAASPAPTQPHDTSRPEPSTAPPGAKARNELRAEGGARKESSAPLALGAPSATEGSGAKDEKNGPAAAQNAAPLGETRAGAVRRDQRGEEHRAAPPSGLFAPPPGSPAREKQMGALKKIEREAAPKPAPTPMSALAPEAKSGRADDQAMDRLRAAPSETQAGARVCGRVHDSSDRPLTAVQVMIADRGVATATDADGRYCLSVPPGDHTLSVMAVGYEPQRRTITVAADGLAADVTMRPVAVLEERGATALMQSAAVWPESLREPALRAQELIDRAERSRSAAGFDAGAQGWEKVLRLARGTDRESAVRSRIADARYRAWQLAPNPKRATSAIEALTFYLARAPLGPERDLAARRLDQLRK
jgi:hypothetical protein